MESKGYVILQDWIRYLTLASARDFASCTALCSASNTLAWLRKLDCAQSAAGECLIDSLLADHSKSQA